MLAAATALATWAALPAAASATWTVQPTPNPPVSVNASLGAVACPAASNCMAVGTYFTTSGNQFGLIEHWNGSKWAVQPNPSGLGGLAGVACTTATNCLAVGANSQGTGLLAERWNGTKWVALTVPSPAGMTAGGLRAVTCTSASSCLAAGFYQTSAGVNQVLVERWNGRSWAVQPVPSRPGTINGIACLSASNCFAAGEDGVTGLVLVEHWDGTKWTVQGTPKLPSIGGGPAAQARLAGVSCRGGICLAAGSFTGQFETPEHTPTRTLGELWNGTKWTLVKTPNFNAGIQGSTDGTAEFSAVSCASATSCAAAGGVTVDNDVPLLVAAATWNGSAWTVGKTPDPSHGSGSNFGGVACAGACTAVGAYTGPSGQGLTLAEHS
jgi:hypothetical protein